MILYPAIVRVLQGGMVGEIITFNLHYIFLRTIVATVSTANRMVVNEQKLFNIQMLLLYLFFFFQGNNAI